MRRQKGFTLLEVLVALTVLAVALAALIRGGSINAGNAIYLQQRSFAHWVALNRISELQLQAEWPALGHDSGDVQMARQEWRWESEISTTLDPGVRRLEVQVFAADNDDGPLTRLIAFLPRPPG